ncbi:MAG TPA: elongation factor G [Candidatus Bathyarchaeia archaeon]|nr:elongation factor G [Candidatus Bathyarchaeia archaeon]
MGNQIVKSDKKVPLGRIRNIGIIAHIDAGKTTTTERVLYYTGKTYKIGDIDEGTTQMDWMDQERERGITIMSAATTTFWMLKEEGAVAEGSYRINIIDTPGHVDFTAEVERSLRVLDGAVMVFDAEEGVQSQSETVWHQASRYHVPRICFINKMDKLGADFDRTVEMIKDRLGAKTAILSYPVGAEKDFRGVVLVLERKAYIWDDKKDPKGEKFEEVEIPKELTSKVEKIRNIVVEAICETDDELTAKFLEGEEITINELKRALRKATVKNQLVPIYVGASLRNKGVQAMLDGIVEFLPSPLDLPPIEGVSPVTGEKEFRPPDPQAYFSGLAFKIQTDPHVGRLTYLRLYSGTIKPGDNVLNTKAGRHERIGRLLLMHANNREEINEAFAGEIVAIVGLKQVTTGDTLCDSAHPLTLESIKFPEPVISLAIEPKTRADQEKLGFALNKLSDEDPTFKIKSDRETGQTIISGMGELHLEIIVDRMKREFQVDAHTGRPQVAYKETIKKTASAEGKYIRQSGGRGQYGHCLLRIDPLGRGEGFKFANEIRGTAIPSVFIPAIEKGVKEAMENGVLAGYPIVDTAVAVYDGSYHEVDSSEIAFKIAGSIALQEAVKRANPVLLEPIMKMEVTTPEEFMGDIIGDLSAKRAQILGTEMRGKIRVIKALIPLAEVSGYATTIRSMSQGRASFYMEPSHYQEVPVQVAEKIVAAKKGTVTKE